MATLNERIKELREEKGLTLLELANLLPVSEATAQRYESGFIINVPYDKILKLAEIFDCSPIYLMGWSEKKDGTSGINVNGSISGSQVLNADNGSSINIGDKQITSQALELVRIYESLDLRRQNKLVNFAFKLEDEAESESSAKKIAMRVTRESLTGQF